MRKIAVQTENFDAGVELGLLAATGAGGLASFTGIVRAQSGARTLTALRLEHYPGMTEAALDKIAREAEARWDLTGCTVIHRVGTLQPGEPIVFTATASAHRAAALAACAFLIDYLKTAAPFWKQELYQDGSSAWIEAREADTLAAGKWKEEPSFL
jgi:molybdopterin synthase catalytic subunit